MSVARGFSNFPLIIRPEKSCCYNNIIFHEISVFFKHREINFYKTNFKRKPQNPVKLNCLTSVNTR